MRDYFRFSGRLNRKPFWLRQLAILAFLLVVVLVVGGITGAMGGFSREPSEAAGTLSALGILGMVVVGIAYLAAIVASLAIQVRRLHDRDKSGWWLLFFIFVPLILQVAFAALGAAIGVEALALVGALASLAISIWFLVEVGFLRGTDGPNRFGPDPLKGPANAEIFS